MAEMNQRMSATVIIAIIPRIPRIPLISHCRSLGIRPIARRRSLGMRRSAR